MFIYILTYALCRQADPTEFFSNAFCFLFYKIKLYCLLCLDQRSRHLHIEIYGHLLLHVYVYKYCFFCSLLYLTNVQACRIRFKETLNISKRQYLDCYCSTSIFYKVFCIASKVIFCH